MIAVIGEHVAAGSEWSPTNARLVQLINDRRRLLFRFRGDNPIDRAAHTQTRQLRKTLPTLRSHSEPRRNLFERAIPFFQLDRFVVHFSATDDAYSRIKNSSWSLTRFTVPAPSVKTKSPGCTCSRNVTAALSSGPM